MAEVEGLLHFGASQVQHAVAQTELFGRRGRVRSPVHRDRRSPRSAHPAELSCPQLEGSGGQVGIGLGAQRHLSNNGDHVLLTELVSNLEGGGLRPIGTQRDLHDPGSIPEVDENQTTEVSAPMHPTRKTQK